MTAPVVHLRKPASLSGKTADAVRELLSHLRDTAPAWAYREVADNLPSRRELGPMTPPLFELCWSSDPEDPWSNCDRIVFHPGPCVWARDIGGRR